MTFKKIEETKKRQISDCGGIELKPCPFCGHEITGKQPYADDLDTCDMYYIIKCGYCGATIYSDNRKETIETWNRRVKE